MGQLALRCETSRFAGNPVASGTIVNAPAPTIACNSAIICSTPSGLPKNRLSAGLSESDGFT